MQITLFTANCTGVKTNCIYPNKVVAESKAEMVEAIKRDHVCAKYTNNYRSNDNFEEAVGIFMDNDNDHSENPADWLTAEKLSELLCDVDHAIATTCSQRTTRRQDLVSTSISRPLFLQIERSTRSSRRPSRECIRSLMIMPKTLPDSSLVLPAARTT